MSKMGDWVIELTHDKVDLTREQFTAKHGEMFAYIWDEQLGIIPEVRRTETRSYNNAEEVTGKTQDNRQKPVPYSRTPILRVRNAKGNGRSGSQVNRETARDVYTRDIQKP